MTNWPGLGLPEDPADGKCHEIMAGRHLGVGEYRRGHVIAGEHVCLVFFYLVYLVYSVCSVYSVYSVRRKISIKSFGLSGHCEERSDEAISEKYLKRRLPRLARLGSQ